MRPGTLAYEAKQRADKLRSLESQGVELVTWDESVGDVEAVECAIQFEGESLYDLADLLERCAKELAGAEVSA